MRRRWREEPEVGEQAVAVGAVDIGTNSMRLLVTDGEHDFERITRVTGLGRGVDATGRLSASAIERTIGALTEFGEIMTSLEVTARRAIATSASRDAENREEFFDLAELALGVRPDLISGDEEAHLAFLGATSHLGDPSGMMVSDIGGGSTEFVDQTGGVSVDIGTVRLTERVMPDRPPSPAQMEAARQVVLDRFSSVVVQPGAKLTGVAGTWTSLAAIGLDLVEYDRSMVHQSELTAAEIDGLIQRLSGLSLEETEAIPALDPNRAPVILAGAVLAAGVMETLGADHVTISERDSLDAVASRLLALP
jgi:exopolyphosphatase/guanosine-5'-triphosphate,3'-diphosphate pyrophosphatase